MPIKVSREQAMRLCAPPPVKRDNYKDFYEEKIESLEKLVEELKNDKARMTERVFELEDFKRAIEKIVIPESDEYETRTHGVIWDK